MKTFKDLLIRILFLLSQEVHYVKMDNKEGYEEKLYFNGTRYCEDNGYTLLKKKIHDILEDFLQSDEIDEYDPKYIDKFYSNQSHQSSFERKVYKDFVLQIKTLSEDLFDNIESIINAKNGIYDFISETLRPQTKDDLNRNVADAKFIVGYLERPEAFHNWIFNMFGRDDLKCKSFYMILGYLFTGDISQKKLFILNGLSNTSKSTLVELIRAILHLYVGVLPSSGLMAKKSGNEDIRPAFVKTRSKRLLIGNELKKSHKFCNSTVKNFTGNDMMSFRKARGEDILFKSRATILYSSNYVAQFEDDNDLAAINRTIVCDCNYPIPEKDQDKDFLKKMSTQEMKDKIFTFILKQGSEYYRNQKNITFHDSFKNSIHRHMMKQRCPVVSFFNECLAIPHKQARGILITSHQLYEKFEDFITDNGYDEVSPTYFFKKLKAILKDNPYVKKSTRKDQPAGYIGLEFKSSISQRDFQPISSLNSRSNY